MKLPIILSLVCMFLISGCVQKTKTSFYPLQTLEGYFFETEIDNEKILFFINKIWKTPLHQEISNYEILTETEMKERLGLERLFPDSIGISKTEIENKIEDIIESYLLAIEGVDLNEQIERCTKIQSQSTVSSSGESVSGSKPPGYVEPDIPPEMNLLPGEALFSNEMQEKLGITFPIPNLKMADEICDISLTEIYKKLIAKRDILNWLQQERKSIASPKIAKYSISESGDLSVSYVHGAIFNTEKEEIAEYYYSNDKIVNIKIKTTLTFDDSEILEGYKLVLQLHRPIPIVDPTAKNILIGYLKNKSISADIINEGIVESWVEV